MQDENMAEMPCFLSSSLKFQCGDRQMYAKYSFLFSNYIYLVTTISKARDYAYSVIGHQTLPTIQ